MQKDKHLNKHFLFWYILNSYLPFVTVLPVLVSVGVVLVQRTCGFLIDGITRSEYLDFPWFQLILVILLIGALSVLKEKVWYQYEYLIQEKVYKAFNSTTVYTKQELLDQFDQGEINTLFIKDANNIIEFANRFFNVSLPGVVSTAVCIFLLMRIDLVLAAMVVVASLLPLFIIRTVSPKMRNASEAYRKQLANTNKSFSTHLYNLEFVKALLLENVFLDNEHIELNLLQKAKRKQNIFNVFCSAPMTASAFITIATTILVGGYLLSYGSISMGDLLSSVILCDTIVSPIMSLSRTWMMYKQAQISSKAIFSYTSLSSESSGNKPVEIIHSVEFECVHFSYDNHEKLFNGLTLKFRPGQLHVILGENGTGKSTLIKLIMGVYKPQNGCIRINGADLKEYDLDSLRNCIATASQEVVVFEGTIWQNLGGESEMTSHYARILGLSEEIENLPGKFETILAWNGKPLSQGQCQRIQVIRALSQKKSIYYFDEPTSAIDRKKVKTLCDIFHELSQNSIIIVNTHDSRIIQPGDRILRIGKNKDSVHE